MSDESSGAEFAARAGSTSARRLHPGAAGRPALDRLTELARRIVGVASSQVSLVTDVASSVGASGVPAELRGDMELSGSLCARTAALRRPLVVNDTRSDPTTAGALPVAAGVAGCFLGVPVWADDRNVVGALCVFDPAPRLWTQEDVATLEALAEAAAAELELAALARDFDANRARWDLAIDAAGVGSFDWNLRTGQLSWDAPLIALFGYDDDDVFAETIEAFNARVHPDDLAAVGVALQRSIDTVGDFEAEYRIVLPDGSTREVQARGRALGRGGIADRVLGAAWDVSVTRASEDRATRLIEAMPVAYLRVDLDGTVLACNDLAEQLLRTPRVALLHRSLWDVLPDPGASRLRDVCAVAHAGSGPATSELRLLEAIDAWFEVRVSAYPDGLSLFFTDISARRRARAAAESAAAHDRAVATTLQQAMLTRLPQPGHLELTARYVAAAQADQVGGDWYDAVVQPNGATTVVVGDVSGHDIDAAATMGQLRSMLRVFIWHADDSPAAVTTALDRAIRDICPGVLATSVTARVEHREGPAQRGAHVVRWTNAGHPPPLLIGPDGTVSRLDAPSELMLGVNADVTRTDHVVELAADSTLVLYTDGLIERRDEDLDVGLRRLADSLARHWRRPLEEMIDHVIAELVDSDADDDVVVLVVRLSQ